MLSEFADLGDIHDARLGVRWDRAQLASEVSNRATALAAAGISAGSTLIIAHAASAGFFADLFAAWSLGCTAACIDPGLTPSEIATLVAFIEPSAILVAEPTGHAGTGVPTFDLSRCSSAAAAICTAKLDPARAALILFTSGTTGQPKGVVLSFRALLARVHLNRAAMGAASQMRTLLTLPTSFGHGLIGNALTPLLSGGEIVLHATGLALAQNLARIIDEYRIGFLSSVPSFWRMALKFSNAPIGDTVKRMSRPHWVDLGDIGWIDEDNKLYVLGRSADLSVMQADFSPLYEIEHTLRLEWDLADAAAVLVKDAAGDAGPQLYRCRR